MSNSLPNIFQHLKLTFTLLPMVISIQIVATAQEKITPLPDGSGWEIKQPDVTQARENISQKKPELVFRKYDEVMITGGGCVQTGGAGKTWKRYIDPAGNNSDRLYHGRIWIPGATDGLVRISSIVGIPLVVNNFPPHATDWTDSYPLILGYEDDNYPDNDYQKRHKDNGNDQCRLGKDRLPIEGLAWLNIKIVHHDASNVPPSSNPRAPVDLWWNAVDDNFLPYNPDWWLHHQHGRTFPNPNNPYALDPSIPNSTTLCNGFEEGPHDLLLMGKSEKCTTWDPDVDEANSKSPFCHVDNPPLLPKSKRVHGHVNWGAVTYRGSIYFDVANNGPHIKGGQIKLCKGASVLGDADYDWLLATDGENGISAANVIDSQDARDKRLALPNDKSIRALALEFSSQETVDVIRAIDGRNSGTWWEQFHANVDTDCDAARTSVRGKQAIVIGLIGFDNEHEKKEKKEKKEEKSRRAFTGARVELHPVWGIAIQVADNPDEERWVIMARNWGNEGSCSNGWTVTHSDWQHWLPLPENKMKFFLPSAAGIAAQTTPDFHCAYYQPSDPLRCNASPQVVTKEFSDGVLLTVQLSQPENKELVWGEVTIKPKSR